MEYDKYGNLEIFRDLGEGEEDAYKTVIQYQSPTYFTFQNATGYPSIVSVYRNTTNTLMRERRATYYNGHGGLFEITTKLNANDNNKISLEYDTFGNLKKVNDLENKNVTNTGYYSKEITYDPILNTFPTSIKNSFQDESLMTGYNYLFGVPMFVEDVNGQRMRTRIDNRGRVVEVTGPNGECSRLGVFVKWRFNRLKYIQDLNVRFDNKGNLRVVFVVFNALNSF